jgi:hypothetical protein
MIGYISCHFDCSIKGDSPARRCIGHVSVIGDAVEVRRGVTVVSAWNMRAAVRNVSAADGTWVQDFDLLSCEPFAARVVGPSSLAPHGYESCFVR